MKRAFKLIFVFVLTSSILISGNGVVFAIHTCLSTASKDVSIFGKSSCCSEEENKCDEKNKNQCDSIDSKCCSLSVVYSKINTPFFLNKSIDFPASLYLFSPVIVLVPFVKTEKVFFHSFIHESSLAIPFLFHQLLI